jgi:hypothetical protein
VDLLFPLTGDCRWPSPDRAKVAAFALLFRFAWHMLDCIIAGFARCPLEGCLPW